MSHKPRDMKSLRLILGGVLICAIALVAVFVVGYLMVPVKPPPVPTPVSLPTPPAAVGCYRYSDTQGWINVTCFVPTPAERHQHPNEGFTGILGMTTASNSSSSSLITRGQVQVSFSQETGELDSIGPPSNPYYGGSFSVQLNTNSFTGSNGQTDAVQFVLIAEHAPNNSSNDSWGVCVWNNGPPAGYTPYCNNGDSTNPLPAQILSSSYSVTLEGDVLSNVTGHFLVATAKFSNGQVISSVAPDTYDLADYWTLAEGTILGRLNGSVAIFFGPTVEDTNVIMTSCSQGWSCGSPTLNGNIIGDGYGYPGGLYTVESNDLTYTKPIAPDTSTLACLNGACTLATESCFMGDQSTCVTSSSIPGFPLESIILGIVIGLCFLTLKRRKSG